VQLAGAGGVVAVPVRDDGLGFLARREELDRLVESVAHDAVELHEGRIGSAGTLGPDVGESPETAVDLLTALVEAEERIRPDRERFLLFRVMGSGSGLPVGHPGLEEDGLHAREQDLEDLADAGLIRLERRPKAWHFNVTSRGFDQVRRLRLANEPASGEREGGLEWDADVLPVLVAAGRAHAANDPDVGFTPEDVASELGAERDRALDRILYELTRADYFEETIGADQSLIPIRMRLTEKGLQVTSGWPGSGEAALERLLGLIEARIDRAASDDERRSWERLRDGVKGVGREAAAEMLGSLAAGFVRGIG
jgi:hypothetical protein